MLGAEREHSPLGDEDLVGDVVGIDRQPQEGGVGDAVAQAGGGVAPSEGSQFYPPAGLAYCELVDDAGVEARPIVSVPTRSTRASRAAASATAEGASPTNRAVNE